MEPLADWTDPAGYPPEGERTLLARWHWEFLRRNADYRRDYATWLRLDHRDPRRPALAARYGLDGVMFDWRDSLEPLFRSPRPADAVRLLRWETTWEENETGRRSEVGPETVQPEGLALRQHECCVVFSLRAPLESQIAAARRRLDAERRRLRERRGRVEEYRLFLRLLDAEAAGVPEERVAAHLYPGDDPFVRRRRLRDALDAAHRLRDGGYRHI